jgi:hypothetical protein
LIRTISHRPRRGCDGNHILCDCGPPARARRYPRRPPSPATLVCPEVPNIVLDQSLFPTYFHGTIASKLPWNFGRGVGLFYIPRVGLRSRSKMLKSPPTVSGAGQLQPARCDVPRGGADPVQQRPVRGPNRGSGPRPPQALGVLPGRPRGARLPASPGSAPGARAAERGLAHAGRLLRGEARGVGAPPPRRGYG